MHIFWINILIFSFEQSSRWRCAFWTHSFTYFTAYTNACEMYHTITAYTTIFPEDEPMGLKHVEGSKIKNWNIDLEIVHFIGLYCIIILQSIVQKTYKNG
jgi:hypothetical protein